ncbi:MAG: hypothetical protein RL769_446 [Pseudomonadota bacterium]|jgi:5-formyltetrahydrofolate cyclo-ligase
MNISQQKKLIRNNYQQLRMQLTSLEVDNRSKLICQNVITNILKKIPELSNLKIACYISAFNEVKCNKIINFLFENNIVIALPKINNNSNLLDFIEYNPSVKLIANQKYRNIFEPSSHHQISPDIIITPLVAFDKKCRRLGMGAGYYDKTIAHLQRDNSKIKTIGLGYDFQEFKPFLTVEKHDLSLDFIASEKTIFLPN